MSRARPVSRVKSLAVFDFAADFPGTTGKT